jgi:hypothetical protein
MYTRFYENRSIMENSLSYRISVSVMKALLHTLHPQGMLAYVAKYLSHHSYVMWSGQVTHVCWLSTPLASGQRVLMVQM